MKVLVIGGSGLFGRKTIASLVQDPRVSAVASVDLVPPADWFLKSIQPWGEKFHFLPGDVSRLEDLLNALKLHPAEVVINWAFIMGDHLNDDPHRGTRVNALGMCNAFEAARLMSVKRVIYASSETVYGPQSLYGDREVTEADQTNPTHAYAVLKLFAEIIAGQYSQKYGISFTGVRAALVCGHGAQARISRLFSDPISQTACGKAFQTTLEGNDLFSLAWADDLAEFTRRLALAASSPHPVYNLGGPPHNLKDIGFLMKKLVPGAKITFGNQPMLGPGQQGMPWKLSMKLAREDFGFGCLPLEEALKIHINDARLEAGLEPLKFKT